VAETVSNTSPLSYLHRLGRLELLRDLFGRVLIPTAVEVEIERGRTLGYDLPDLRGIAWIEVRSAEGDAFEDLGAGETGVLNLARALPDPLVILYPFGQPRG
jgi:predicted nucleic acid-binding protein